MKHFFFIFHQEHFAYHLLQLVLLEGESDGEGDEFDMVRSVSETSSTGMCATFVHPIYRLSQIESMYCIRVL